MLLFWANYSVRSTATAKQNWRRKSKNRTPGTVQRFKWIALITSQSRQRLFQRPAIRKSQDVFFETTATRTAFDYLCTREERSRHTADFLFDNDAELWRIGIDARPSSLPGYPSPYSPSRSSTWSS